MNWLQTVGWGYIYVVSGLTLANLFLGAMGAMAAASRDRAVRQASIVAHHNSLHWAQTFGRSFTQQITRTLQAGQYSTPKPDGEILQILLQHNDLVFALEQFSFLEIERLRMTVGQPRRFAITPDGRLIFHPSADRDYMISVVVDIPPQNVFIDQPEAVYGGMRARIKIDDPESRSIQLLKEWLTTEQCKEFEDQRCFTVYGSHSGHKYRINCGTVFNVHYYNAENKHACSLCFQPIGCTHIGDLMLAQKITLEKDEEAAWRVANKQPVLVDVIRSPIPSPAAVYAELSAVRRAFRGRGTMDELTS